MSADTSIAIPSSCIKLLVQSQIIPSIQTTSTHHLKTKGRTSSLLPEIRRANFIVLTVSLLLLPFKKSVKKHPFSNSEVKNFPLFEKNSGLSKQKMTATAVYGRAESRNLQRNMSSALCASSMYSRLCMTMLSFLFARAWTMPHISFLSCGIPFPVQTPAIISGLTSVVVWLSWGEVIKKKLRVVLQEREVMSLNYS